MSLLPDILAFNRSFVENRLYEPLRSTRYPTKRLVIVTCMDTRLVELLPRAMNLANGEVKIIKTAGAVVAAPFGSVMRSILVAVYELHAREVLVVGHHDCGMTRLSADSLLAKARARGIPDATITTLRRAGIDLDRWLQGFPSVHDAVQQSVTLIRQHPLLPPDILVHPLLIHPTTGQLELLPSSPSSPPLP